MTVYNLNRLSLEYLSGQVNEIKKKVKELRSKLKNSPRDLQTQLEAFLHEADEEVSSLVQSVKDVEEMNKHLADYFCEDAKKFKPEECMAELNMFLLEFESAIKVKIIIIIHGLHDQYYCVCVCVCVTAVSVIEVHICIIIVLRSRLTKNE